MSYIDELPETEELFIDSDLKTEYTTILKESNKLVKYLMKEMDELQHSLKEERKRNVELQAKLELQVKQVALVLQVLKVRLEQLV